MKADVFIILAIAFFIGSSVACASTPPGAPPSAAILPPTNTLAPTFAPSPQPTFTSTPSATPSLTPSATPSRTPTLAANQRYTSAFGIDYGQPEKYLAPGGQTHLSNPQVIDSLRGKPQSIATLGEIYFWIQRGFKPWSAGGATIGVVTVDQLFAERRLGGCHDWGLVYATIARELGYPAVMVDTMSIMWVKQVQSGQKVAYDGHVFAEVFVDGKWIIVDSTNNWYAENNYDPANPVIPLKGAIATGFNEDVGFYVMRKGVDSWGYGIRSNAELTRLMDESARQLNVAALQFPPYNFQRFK